MSGRSDRLKESRSGESRENRNSSTRTGGESRRAPDGERTEKRKSDTRSLERTDIKRSRRDSRSRSPTLSKSARRSSKDRAADKPSTSSAQKSPDKEKKTVDSFGRDIDVTRSTLNADAGIKRTTSSAAGDRTERKVEESSLSTKRSDEKHSERGSRVDRESRPSERGGGSSGRAKRDSRSRERVRDTSSRRSSAAAVEPPPPPRQFRNLVYVPKDRSGASDERKGDVKERGNERGRDSTAGTLSSSSSRGGGAGGVSFSSRYSDRDKEHERERERGRERDRERERDRGSEKNKDRSRDRERDRVSSSSGREVDRRGAREPSPPAGRSDRRTDRSEREARSSRDYDRGSSHSQSRREDTRSRPPLPPMPPPVRPSSSSGGGEGKSNTSDKKTTAAGSMDMEGAPMAEEEEEVVPPPPPREPRWALELPSLLVCKRLAGPDLYKRIRDMRYPSQSQTEIQLELSGAGAEDSGVLAETLATAESKTGGCDGALIIGASGEQAFSAVPSDFDDFFASLATTAATAAAVPVDSEAAVSTGNDVPMDLDALLSSIGPPPPAPADATGEGDEDDMYADLAGISADVAVSSNNEESMVVTGAGAGAGGDDDDEEEDDLYGDLGGGFEEVHSEEGQHSSADSMVAGTVTGSALSGSIASAMDGVESAAATHMSSASAMTEDATFSIDDLLASCDPTSDVASGAASSTQPAVVDTTTATAAIKAPFARATPPPLRTMPYVLQDMSYARTALYSKALKGQGFPSIFLQSLPQIVKLFDA